MTYSLPVAPPSSVWPLQLLRREGWEGLAELAQGREIYWAKEAVLPRVGLEEERTNQPNPRVVTEQEKN